MKLTDLNRTGAIGSNSTLLQIGTLNILIDTGLHPKLSGRKALPEYSLLENHHIDLCIITHCHLDHLGSIPVFAKLHPETPILMTLSSHMLAERMLHNSVNVMTRQKEENNIADLPLFTHNDVERIAKRFTSIPFGQSRTLSNTRDHIQIILHPAGHVAGAAGVEIIHKRRHIFITGDVLFDNQRTLKGAQFPAGHFDTLIMETTRGSTERAPEKTRPAEVARLISTINDTIQRGGSILIPVFALGRHQEILTLLHDAQKTGKLTPAPIYSGGLGMDLCDYFDDISRKTKHVQFNRSILKDLKIKKLPQLQPGQDPETNAIYVISSGMVMPNTPSYTLASGLLRNARNTIAFVGYCDPETPGGHLLSAKTGTEYLFETIHTKAKIQARIERFELSGHADRDQLLQFAIQATPRTIILTHGDPPARQWFADQLAEQLPKTKTLDPIPLQAYQV